MRTLGIIGGMGPQASARFHQLLVDEITRHGTVSGTHFPRFLLSNLPVPEFFGGRDPALEERAVSMVEQEARTLRDAGAEVLMITCNTMHMYMQRFRERIRDVEWLSMIDEVVQTVRDYRLSIIGLLGSQSTIESGLYGLPLMESGVTVKTPSSKDQEAVVELIAGCIAGSTSAKDTDRLTAIMERPREEGAEGIVLGCTELPLVARITGNTRGLVSSLHVLVKAACDRAFAP